MTRRISSRRGFRARWLAACILGPLILSHDAALAATEPTFLQRSERWNVNYDADSCSLFGTFGSGEDTIIVHFVRFAPSTFFNLTLVGAPFKSPYSEDNLTVDFGPTINPRRFNTMNGTWGSQPMAILQDPVRLDDYVPPAYAREFVEPPMTPAMEQAVTSLTVTVSGRKAYRLDLGPMDRAMAAMNRCTSDLVKSWGLDPTGQATLSRRAKPRTSPNSWIDSSDYPTNPLHRGQPSLVRFRLMVDEKGAVTGCHIQRATQGPAFERATCTNMMRHGRFEPALDASGKPVASYYASAVRFIIR